MNRPPETGTVFQSDELLLLRRNRWVLGAAVSLPLVAIVWIAAQGIERSLLVPVGILGVFLVRFAYRENLRPWIVPVAVRADASGVSLGSRFLPRSQIRAGLIAPGVAPRVLLRRRLGPPVVLQTDSEAQARDLLSALGLDAEQVSADFRGLSWIFTRFVYTLPVVFGLPLAAAACAELVPHGRDAAPWIIALWFALWALPTRICVGAGGVTLHWLGIRSSLGYAEIEDVTAYQHQTFGHYFESGLAFRLAAGTLRLPIRFEYRRMGGESDAAGASYVGLVWERIRQAAVAFNRSNAASAPLGRSPVAGEDEADPAAKDEENERARGSSPGTLPGERR
jgi:hypothetical protein